MANNTFAGGNSTPIAGIYLSDAGGISLGGSTSGEGNRVSGASRGVFATGEFANATIRGTAIEGTGAGSYGVYLSGATNLAIGGGGLADGVNVTGTQYGLYGAGVLSGTQVEGSRFNGGLTGASLVNAQGLTLRANTYESNTYGVFASGTSDGTTIQGNEFNSNSSAVGVYLSNASNITVGVAGLTGGNLIEKAGTGISVFGSMAGATLQNNNIRNAATGISLSGVSGLTVDSNTLYLASVAGLSVSGTNSGVTISGNSFEFNTVAINSKGSGIMIDGNTIAGSIVNGIVVDGATATGNTILNNSIFNNGGQGISLQNGGNDGQVAPTISSATSTNVSGTMTGTNGDVFTIQVFKTTASLVPSADRAQGQTFVKEFNVTIGVGGSEVFSEALSGITVGDWITLTATKLDGGTTPTNTSAFSLGAQIRLNTLICGSTRQAYRWLVLAGAGCKLQRGAAAPGRCR
ncbi:MAG: hypothetical protein EBU59_12055 [Planctomycetia bacterium]|nr:hypothetical protein [Planctomycetia bacterium]